MTGVDVLAVAAHPDDAEVGCGGVLALCSAAGTRVAIADLTAGELSTRGTLEQRRLEAHRAAEILGVVARVDVGLPDGGVGEDPAHRAAVVTVLRELRPTVVLAPYHRDDRHPDHAAAGRLVREACFFAGVARWGEGAPHRPALVHHYMLHHTFEPTFVVDVSTVWAQRVAALAAYESQFGGVAAERTSAISGGAFLDMLAARATVHGAMIGVERGEAFHCEGPLGLDSLPGLRAAREPGPPVYRAFL